MLPAAEELVAGLGFLARRHGVAVPSKALIVAASAEAQRLCEDSEQDEPAALLFCLARRARGLGALCWVGPALVANGHARQLGLPAIPEQELRRLALDVAQRRMTYLDVRAWFRERWARDL